MENGAQATLRSTITNHRFFLNSPKKSALIALRRPMITIPSIPSIRHIYIYIIALNEQNRPQIDGDVIKIF